MCIEQTIQTNDVLTCVGEGEEGTRYSGQQNTFNTVLCPHRLYTIILTFLPHCDNFRPEMISHHNHDIVEKEQ